MSTEGKPVFLSPQEGSQCTEKAERKGNGRLPREALRSPVRAAANTATVTAFMSGSVLGPRQLHSALTGQSPKANSLYGIDLEVIEAKHVLRSKTCLSPFKADGSEKAHPKPMQILHCTVCCQGRHSTWGWWAQSGTVAETGQE